MAGGGVRRGAGAGPLDGVRVLDLSAVLSGPLATTLLAEQGADVVKVEAPGFGDLVRHVSSSRGGMGAMFHLANRGKRGIVLDVRSGRGRDVLLRLAAATDVVVQNFRPGVVERLGIGYEDVRAVRPEVVYCSISGFGDDGPYAPMRVYDNVIQCASGVAATQRGADGEPSLLRNLACDKVTAHVVAQAVTAALFARERGAGGQHVRVAMLDVAISFLWTDAGADQVLLGDGVRHLPPIGANYSLIRFADGWGTAAPLSDAEFRGLCRAFGVEHVADDPRFATIAQRVGNPTFREVYRRDVLGAAARLGVDDAMARLAAEDVPAAPVVAIRDVHAHPQVVANGTFVEREHPAAGPLREPRPAPRFSATPSDVGRPAPLQGEHTDEVLAEAGYDPAEVAALRADGIVA